MPRGLLTWVPVSIVCILICWFMLVCFVGTCFGVETGESPCVNKCIDFYKSHYLLHPSQLHRPVATSQKHGVTASAPHIWSGPLNGLLIKENTSKRVSTCTHHTGISLNHYPSDTSYYCRSECISFFFKTKLTHSLYLNWIVPCSLKNSFKDSAFVRSLGKKSFCTDASNDIQIWYLKFF